MLLEERAGELGFAQLGVVQAEKMLVDLEILKRSISKGYHAGMTYLERNHHIRKEPALLLEGAKSIVVTITSYKPAERQPAGKPGIASYAYGMDYHIVLKKRLNDLASLICDHHTGTTFRVFTDSAPIFERSLAVKAGLGFIGKNTFLINPHHGLHTLIGVIITNQELYYPDYGKKGNNLCGSCTRCLDACPTKALRDPFVMDARRCISYQTIEDKRLYDPAKDSNTRSGMVFGCDICMDACPWSRKGDATQIEEFRHLRLTDGTLVTHMDRARWKEIDSLFFKQEFKKSPLFRAGLEKIINNLDYELANQGGNPSFKGEDPV
jgi:epoxyqueuosine reductase